MKYVAIPLIPSSDDTAAVKTEMKRIAKELKTSEEDSVYASQNSDSQNAFGRYTPGTLPAFVNQDSLVQGKVFGPFLDETGSKWLKSPAYSTTRFTAHVSHILFRWSDESDASKKVAKENALKVLKEIKAGASSPRRHVSMVLTVLRNRVVILDGSANNGRDGETVPGCQYLPRQNQVFSMM